MKTIHVPGPPKEAFNKHRQISDLIKAQIKHFRHLEEKLSSSVRATLPQHVIVSENDAALYIASMTRLLHIQSTASTTATPSKPIKSPTAIRFTKPVSLAAIADTAKTARKKTVRRKTKKAAAKSRGKK